MITLTEPQARLVPLLEQRLSTLEILAELDWSRQYLHAVIKSLTQTGLLRSGGELPPGAKASTSPSAEALGIWSAVMNQDNRIGCDDATSTRVRRELTRVGMLQPDDRPQWSGHTIRRVEWTVDGLSTWVVQGLLVPRADGRAWSNATPDHRIVVVSEDSWRPVHWLDERGLVVPLGSLTKQAEFSGLPTDTLVGLTMAVAWVLESRALLDAEALNSKVLK